MTHDQSMESTPHVREEAAQSSVSDRCPSSVTPSESESESESESGEPIETSRSSVVDQGLNMWWRKRRCPRGG